MCRTKIPQNSKHHCREFCDEKRSNFCPTYRTEIAAIFAICDCDAHRGPQKLHRFPRQEKAMLHCDLRMRCKVASDLRFRAAMSEPKTASFCRISGDLAPSTRKSLAIAIVRFWCAKTRAAKLSEFFEDFLCFDNFDWETRTTDISPDNHYIA